MAKRPPIVLDGKPLQALSVLDIVDIASRRGRTRYDLGPCADFERNWLVLKAFNGQTERTSSELVAAIQKTNLEWSEQFHALRAGEALGWGIEHGIVQRVPYSSRWQLLQPERQFEVVGGLRNQRAIRVRGIADAAEHAEATKLWNRELKRRERERLREIEKHRPAIVRALNRITRLAPDTKLEGYFAEYAVGGYDTFGACKQYIIDCLDDLQTSPFVMSLELEAIADALQEPPKPEPIPAEDLEELKGLRL